MAINLSCSRDNYDIDTASTDIIKEKQSNDEIAEAAISFVSTLKDEKITRSISNLSVKNIQKLKFDSENLTRAVSTIDMPDYYSVGMDNNMGTVLLANKDNIIAPLAYFEEENDVNINDALNDTVSTFSFIVQMLVEQNIDMEVNTNTNYPTTRAVTNTIVERLEPKCRVWWYQDFPFNYYCPIKDGNRTQAGCVAIAGAQALTVLRPNEPIISSWDAVINEDPFWAMFGMSSTMSEIAMLIHEIGVNVDMKYGTLEENGSSASKSNLIKYFKKKYGVEDYDCKRAIDVLKTEHGVIIIGGFSKKKKSGILFWEKNKYYDGHTFIADGYVKYGNNGTKQNDDPYYLHINYGGKNTSHNAYILSVNKKYTEDAKDYTYNGLIYQYNISYATLTYPSEKNW